MMDIAAGSAIDSTSTWGVDQDLVHRLTALVVAGPDCARERTHTPLTGEPLADLPVSTAQDVAAAIERSRAVQAQWAQVPLRERGAILLRFHDLVLRHQRELLDLVQLESGKARRSAFEEVADCALVARHYARASAGYLRDRRAFGAFSVLTQSVESRRPKGVVGVVSPWNYPLSLAITDALPALMAGNGVVLRPDLQGSLTALYAVGLLIEAGLPAGLFTVVLGPGASTGQAVVDQADYVCYTGSTATGRSVGVSAARTASMLLRMPTSHGPLRGRSDPASPAPASCASPPNGSWCTTRSMTRSCLGSWRPSGRSGSGPACPGGSTWVRWSGPGNWRR